MEIFSQAPRHLARIRVRTEIFYFSTELRYIDDIYKFIYICYKKQIDGKKSDFGRRRQDVRLGCQIVGCVVDVQRQYSQRSGR